MSEFDFSDFSNLTPLGESTPDPELDPETTDLTAEETSGDLEVDVERPSPTIELTPEMHAKHVTEATASNSYFDGSTVELEWSSYGDGTSWAWGPDGSYYEQFSDGSVAQWCPDGSTILHFPDGSAMAWDAYGMPYDPFAFVDGNGTGTDLGTDTGTDLGTDLGADDPAEPVFPDVPGEDEGRQNLGEETGYGDDSVSMDDWDGVYGNSYEWHDDWFFQEIDGYCGPTSVAIIVNEYFGANIADPNYMADQAYQQGLVEDISQGMPIPNILELLQSQGVPAERSYSSMEDLGQRLESGYGVIAMVDSGELWGDPADEYYEDNTLDHALVVTEVNVYDGTVTLADPGTPDGNAMVVPIDEFEDAWADSGYDMISTTEPDPDLVAQDTASAGGAPAADSADRPDLALINLSGSDRIR
ncbi:C39 family peptidase [Corynebacterium frankenforstense]